MRFLRWLRGRVYGRHSALPGVGVPAMDPDLARDLRHLTDELAEVTERLRATVRTAEGRR